jgi:thioredoxin
MKNTFTGLIFLSVIWLSSCGGSAAPTTNSESPASAGVVTEQTNSTAVTEVPASDNESGKVVYLTKAMFLEKVYNYEKDPKQWSYLGDKPCIIDFYATWCRPCKMVAPIMDELAEKYKGQITIYKVDTDQERELAQFFGIRSIPTMYYCPTKGDPQMSQGALDKETYEKVINEVLLQNKQ